MYPPDRSQIQAERQTKSSDLAFIEKLSIPAVIRDNDRTFSVCNRKFFDEIIAPLSSADEWFSSLSIQTAIFLSSVELKSMCSTSDALNVSRIEINDQLWTVQFLPLIDASGNKSLWLFYSGVLSDNYPPTNIFNSNSDCEKILDYKKQANETQWRVFLLYVYGFKHSSIANFLSIENGVSRNIIIEINKFFDVESKHFLQVMFYNSGLSDDYLIELRKIMSGSAL